MKLEVGKYYRFAGENSFIVGPMSHYDSDRMICGGCGEVFWVDGNTYYRQNQLVEEVVVPEGQPIVGGFKVGMCVKKKKGGHLRWVTPTPLNNRFGDTESRSYESNRYLYSPEEYLHVPEFDLSPPVELCREKYYRVGDDLLKNCRVALYMKGSDGLDTRYPTNMQFTCVGDSVGGGYIRQFKPEDIVEVFDTNPWASIKPHDLVVPEGHVVTMRRRNFGGISKDTLENGGLYLRVQDEGAYWTFLNLKDFDDRVVYTYDQTFAWEFQVHETLTYNDPVVSQFTLVDFPASYHQSELTKYVKKYLPEGLEHIFSLRALVSGFKQATQNRANFALYLNQKQKDAKRIQSLRPGRALRALLPEITDALLEKIVDGFRKDFPTGDYVVRRGFEAENFKHMYAHTMASMQNPRTTNGRKSLGNSCMRHACNFERLPYHPAEAYASGEFEAIWSETPDGRIASRLVVWHPPEGHRLHGKPQCGPVYGTCEYSIDLLEEVAKGMGANLYNDATWAGAKWQKLPYNGGVIAPYSDHEQSIEDCGDYLMVGGDCDYEAHDYSGVLGGRGDDGFDCDECGTYIDPNNDDYYHTDRGCICDSCRDHYYFYCEDYEEDRPRDEMCTVYRTQRWGNNIRYVCEAARDESYTLCVDNDEYWDNDEVTILANGDAISPAGRDSGDYAECVVDNEWYSVTEMYPLVEGGYIAKVNFDETTHARNDLGEVYEREAA